jgi:hypothetical protein
LIYYTVKHKECDINGIAIPITCKYKYQEPMEENKDAILMFASCAIGIGEFVGMICNQKDKCPLNNISKTLPYPY